MKPDIVICGGGLVGASLAAALASQRMRLTIVEPRDLIVALTADQVRLPTLALSTSSQQILQGIGIWSTLSKQAVPIASLHISHRGLFGRACFHADQHQVDALGFVVPGKLVLRALYDFLQQHDNVRFCFGAKLSQLQTDVTGAYYELTDEHGQLQVGHADLLVAADGAQSSARGLLGIRQHSHDYQQHAIVAHAATDKPHQYTAYERFIKGGAIAVLPLAKNQVATIWVAPNADFTRLQALSDQAYAALLQQQLGSRLGKLQLITARHNYPLRYQVSDEQIRPAAVLLGNASHSLHPIAAQGFNLSLRDVAVLAETIASAQALGDDVGSDAVLQRYLAARQNDQRFIIRFTDLLSKWVHRSSPGFNLLMSASLLLLDNFPALRRQFAKPMLGLAGRLSRLAAGAPLVGEH